MARDELPLRIRKQIYALEHGLLDDETGRAVNRVLRSDIDEDGFAGRYLSNTVFKHKIAQAFAGPFALPKLVHGNLCVGMSAVGALLWCLLVVLNGHCLTIGGSGSGKTNKARFLALQVAPRVKGFWGFDMAKRELAVLRPYLARCHVDLIVVTARQLRLNPLQLPGAVSPADWAARMAEMLVQVLTLPPRATKLLHASLIKLYRRFHIFDGSTRFPTLFELREAIVKDTYANAQARLAILDALDPVLLSIGDALAFRTGWTSADLAKRHIVYEFGGASEVDKDFLLNAVLLPLFTERVARGVSNRPMDLWICIDEAQKLVSTSRASGGLGDLIGLIRGTGIGLALSIQSSHDVAPAIYSNTANKFVGRCGSAADYDAIGSAMGLTVEQRRYMALHLEPGLFAGQLGEGWRKPFLCRVPHLPLTPKSAPAPTNAPPQPSQPSSGLGDLLQLPVIPA